MPGLLQGAIYSLGKQVLIFHSHFTGLCKVKVMLEKLMGQASQTRVALRLLQYLQKINFLKLAQEDGMWKQALLAWRYMPRVPKPPSPEASPGKGAAGRAVTSEQGRCPGFLFHVAAGVAQHSGQTQVH